MWRRCAPHPNRRDRGHVHHFGSPLYHSRAFWAMERTQKLALLQLNWNNSSQTWSQLEIWGNRTFSFGSKRRTRGRSTATQEQLIPGWDQASDFGMQHPLEAFSYKSLSDGRSADVQSSGRTAQKINDELALQNIRVANSTGSGAWGAWHLEREGPQWQCDARVYPPQEPFAPGKLTSGDWP